MARTVLIVGDSGSGKTFSLMNFKPEEVCYINPSENDLPFNHTFHEMHVNLTDYNKILNIMRKTKKKVIVLDNVNHILNDRFFLERGNYTKKEVFDFYDALGIDYFKILRIPKQFDDNKVIYFMSHIKKSEDGCESPFSIGNVIDTKMVIQSYFNIVLKAEFEDVDKYVFYTKRRYKEEFTKTPYEMFDEDVIANDLKMVDTTIRNYYGLEKL